MVTGVVLSSPRFLPSIFIAHRVQQSHCSSIFHRVFLTHALLAFSARQFVRKKKSQQIFTSMHSGGFELTKLTYTRLEDNVIRHRGDRIRLYKRRSVVISDGDVWWYGLVMMIWRLWRDDYYCDDNNDGSVSDQVSLLMSCLVSLLCLLLLLLLSCVCLLVVAAVTSCSLYWVLTYYLQVFVIICSMHAIHHTYTIIPAVRIGISTVCT